MKKYKLMGLMAAMTFMLTACSEKNNSIPAETESATETEIEIASEQKTEAETEQTGHVDLPQMTFFKRNKEEGTFEKASDAKSEWSYHKDIASFYLFPDNADEKGFLYEGFKEYWNQLWQSYEDTESAKIAYEITIILTDGTEIVKTLTKPSDADDIYDYIEIYVYDDLHQLPGAWYSHLTDDKMNDDTIMNSIKITSGVNVNLVTKVELKAFAYCTETEYMGMAQSVELTRQFLEE